MSALGSRLCENSETEQFKRTKFFGRVTGPYLRAIATLTDDEFSTLAHAVNESPEFSHSLRSKADIPGGYGNVRFTPESGRRRD